MPVDIDFLDDEQIVEVEIKDEISIDMGNLTIAYADSNSPQSMEEVYFVKGTHKYIGIYQGLSEPTSPTQFNWALRDTKEIDDAITLLGQNLTNEVTRAKAKEDSLEEDIEDLEQSQTTLETSITNEATRATNSEQALDTKITNETSQRQSAISNVTQALNGKQDKLTSDNAGVGIAISEEGVISSTSAQISESEKTKYDGYETSKQEKLESGTNIKTINNQSILGSGNIEIQGGESSQSDWNETDSSKASYIKNKPTNFIKKDEVITISNSERNTKTTTSGAKYSVTDNTTSDATFYENGKISRALNHSMFNINLPSEAGTFALTKDIPEAVTEETISGWGFVKEPLNNKIYKTVDEDFVENQKYDLPQTLTQDALTKCRELYDAIIESGSGDDYATVYYNYIYKYNSETDENISTSYTITIEDFGIKIDGSDDPNKTHHLKGTICWSASVTIETEEDYNEYYANLYYDYTQNKWLKYDANIDYELHDITNNDLQIYTQYLDNLKLPYSEDGFDGVYNIEADVAKEVLKLVYKLKGDKTLETKIDEISSAQALLDKLEVGEGVSIELNETTGKVKVSASGGNKLYRHSIMSYGETGSYYIIIIIISSDNEPINTNYKLYSWLKNNGYTCTNTYTSIYSNVNAYPVKAKMYNGSSSIEIDYICANLSLEHLGSIKCYSFEYSTGFNSRVYTFTDTVTEI